MQSGLELWSGQFGDDYTRRNQVDWRSRLNFWRRIINDVGVRSAFEVGCNAGWNLSAIQYLFPHVKVAGNDINELACEQALAAGLPVYNQLDFTAIPGRAELVFTAGVLIHIEPEHLAEVMTAIAAKSYRWVLAVEYDAPEEVDIEYRGEKGRCWKRPYGRLYEELGLKIVDRPPCAGFDRCTAWLLEK